MVKALTSMEKFCQAIVAMIAFLNRPHPLLTSHRSSKVFTERSGTTAAEIPTKAYGINRLAASSNLNHHI